MQTTLNAAVQSYLRAKGLSRGTRNEYFSTLRKWEQWGNGVEIEELRRKSIREFLDWVYERAVATKERILDALRTRLASICERSFRGLGSRSSSISSTGKEPSKQAGKPRGGEPNVIEA